MNRETVTDSTGKRNSLDVEAESMYDAAHLFLTKAKEASIREFIWTSLARRSPQKRLSPSFTGVAHILRLDVNYADKT